MLEGPQDIARASYLAYANEDRTTIEALIADDFHFTSPLENRINRATYFARCWPNRETITGFEFIQLVSIGDHVFVTYEASSTREQRFRNTELLTIRRGKITKHRMAAS